MTMPGDFVPSIVPSDSEVSDPWWFIYSGFRLLVQLSDGGTAIPIMSRPEDLGLKIVRPLYLGTFRERPCYAAEGEIAGSAPTGVRFQDIRSVYGGIEEDLFKIVLTAVHLVEWDKNHQFCSSCRGALKDRRDMRAKECESCGRLEFPRLSPAIIVSVEKDDMLLLARSARFPGEFFSVLAGFVEPGESLEEAVRREVMEETGIRVKDIAYFGSQPWPFPESLMIGFTAQYESGEIRIDGEEIVEAGWYRSSELPRIPGPVSIARKLIDSFVNKHS
jgi:NAD+ diphosphatase